MSKKVAAAVVSTIVLAVAAIGCGPRVIRGRALEQARDRWRSAQISDYTWRIDTGCFGACSNGTPVTIVVRGGHSVRMMPNDSDVRRFLPSTVEELFERIDGLRGSDGYSVTFDPSLGYPVHGAFDPSRGSIDEEWGFTVRSLQAE
jgi:Family of unknown function (DUF6174)